MTAHETINTYEAIRIFHELMRNDAQKRILCLIGDAKMGKSHLLTHVFPLLAEGDYKANYAILDLSDKFSTVRDVLSQICIQLGNHSFHAYNAAERDLIKYPKVYVSNLGILLSRFTISNRDSQNEFNDLARHLTLQFIEDIRQLNDHPMLLLFDSLEKASEEMKGWLRKILLLSTSRLKHVRIVMAGRSLSGPYTGYQTLCQSYTLSPIMQINEYMTYCQHKNFTLSEEQIRTLAHAFDYIPGLFVDVLPKFAVQKVKDE